MKKCFWKMPLAVIFGLALALTGCESDAGETTPVIPVNPTPTPVVTDWKTVPLTLEFIAAGKIQVERAPNGFQYTVNGGLMQNYTAPITGNPGDKVCFFAAGTGSGSGSTNYLRIISPDTKCYVYGNVMSLVNKTDYATATELNNSYVFKGLFFENTFLTSHPTNQLVLPATTLSNYCYQDMFSGCTGLTTAPELLATTLTEGCYKAMFKGCTGLTKAPELPAASLTTDSYDDMFYGCSNLNYIKCLLTTPSFSDSGYWVKDVAVKGTFVKAKDSDWTKGADGIPIDWDVTEEKVPRKSGTIKFDEAHIVKNFVGEKFTNALTNVGDGSVTYTSSEPAVATVDASTGEVTTVGKGEATITATVSDTALWEYEVKTATYELKVTSSNPAKAAGSISYATTSLEKVTTDEKFTNALTKVGDGAVTYKSSNTAVATVDASTGEVTLVGEGETTITATVADGDTHAYATKTASYTIKVSKAAGSISYATTSVNKYTTDEKFTNALTKVGDGAVTYKSNNTAVATVDASTGEVTLVGEGEASITATVTDSSKYAYATKTASYKIVVSVNPLAMPLTFKYLGTQWTTQKIEVCIGLQGTAGFSDYGLEYSTDGGKTWTAFDKYYVEAYRPISVRATKTRIDNINYFTIYSGNKNNLYVSGNIMSLLGYKTGDELMKASKVPDKAFSYLFSYAKIDIADNEPLYLPATELGKNCYEYMFANCEILKKAPELPAMTMNEACYFCMFQYCKALETAPALPATTLAKECYALMFENCTALTTAPALPATTMAEECYKTMFKYCKALTTAPALPATTLANGCYLQMFFACEELEKAPDLPAKKLVERAYLGMFWGCTKLKSIKCLATEFGSYSTSGWVSTSLAADGTFTKAAGVTWPTGEDGIPSGWTVIEE